ncbi:MAG: hypothetical protein A2020_01340 [Lentisphaerae bacterium GWF2_45_14]|nr:MAG: hypothetical protein A2020_01340 [Lentisphaerae bacterium GWF2_45_14]
MKQPRIRLTLSVTHYIKQFKLKMDKEKKMNSTQVKEKVREAGADLVGIASLDRFKDLPAESNPLSVFPQCKSVIVVGRRILRGAFRGVEEGTNFGSTYGCFGHSYLENQFLSKTIYDVTCYLEKEGIEAVPLLGYRIKGEDKVLADGKPAANVILDYKILAQAAGLGEIGKGGFFLTPEFGHRQRFGMILVDEAFDADELKKVSLCENCDACAKGCPLKSIHAEKTISAGLKGHETDIFTIDEKICKVCKNGAFSQPVASDGVDRYAAACGRACMTALENKVSNRFENKFRKRSVWSVDINGSAAELSFVGGQAPVKN